MRRIIDKELHHLIAVAKLDKYHHLSEPLFPYLLKKKINNNNNKHLAYFLMVLYQILENSYRFEKVQGSSLLAQEGLDALAMSVL